MVLFSQSAAVFGISFAALVFGLPLTPRHHHHHLSHVESGSGITPIQPGSYFVEFYGEPNISTCDHEHAQFNNDIQKHDIKVYVRNSFKRLFNGVAINIADAKDLGRLHSLPSVKRTWPIQMRHRSVGIPSSNVMPNLMFAHRHTGVNKAQRELGLDGTGIKVGVIDTGVDYMHPDLGGCFKTPGCPFQYGYDFVGNGYDSATSAHPAPGPDPRDTCDGHGTHVTGIIAAHGPRVRGVAPGVTLGIYRIFGCPGNGTGQAADDVILKAMEAAHADGMDVVNMSFGGGSGWSEDPLSVAASRLVRDGIVMVASAGNAGSNGLYTSGSPGLGVGVINVASFDNWMITSLSIDITAANGNMSIVHSSPGNSKYRFKYEYPAPVTAPIDSEGSVEGCAPYTGSFPDQILLIKRGNCTFVEKAAHAQAAGAVGVMVYNTEPELMSPTSASPNVTIPLVVIKSDDGQAILDDLKLGKVTLTATNHTVSVNNPSGGQISSFSSWGPDPELYLSPAVGAPGGDIFSTFPLALGGYTSLSGTSMASPYVAGMAALILQARSKNVDVDTVRQLILESARPTNDVNSTSLMSPLRQGSGLVNVFDSVTVMATIEPPHLALNYTAAWATDEPRVANEGFDQQSPNKVWPPHPYAPAPKENGAGHIFRELTLYNHHPTSFLTSTMTNVAALSVSSFMANGSFAAVPRTWPEETVTEDMVSKDTQPQAYLERPRLPIRIQPGGSQRVQVRIVPPAGLGMNDRWFYGGYMRFNLLWDDQVGTTQTLHVPYMGYLGDYTKLDVLSQPSENLPSLGVRGSAETLKEGSHVAINRTQRLSVHYRLEHPTRILKLRLVNEDNVPLGYLPYGYLEYMGRNYQGRKSRYSNSTINGTLYQDPDLTRPFKASPGTYKVRLDALRPLRNPDDPEGFQVWYSPKFVLDSVTLATNATADRMYDEDSQEEGHGYM